jgi:hypothetical protein
MLITEIVIGLVVGAVVAAGMVGLWELTGPLDRPTDTLWEDKDDPRDVQRRP